MHFGLTDEQAMVQDSARRYAAERAAPTPDVQGVDPANWKELADQGFLILGLPEEQGGLGGAVEISVVCQEFGRGPVTTPYVGAGIFPAQLVLAAGSDAQKDAWLPAIAAGELIVAVAYREAGNPGRRAPRTMARRDGADYVLSGQKSLVIAGTAADRLIVSARLGDGQGTTLFLVDAKAAGVKIIPTPLVDGSWAAEIHLEDVVVPASDMLGGEGQGDAPLGVALRYALLGASSEIVGMMNRSLEIAADYIKVRKQFGSALADFQVLRHRIADMTIDCEMADAAVLKMVASFENPGEHDPVKSAALAKALLDELGHRVCSQGIQLHGGMGLTEECEIGRFYTRYTAVKAMFGSPAEYMAEYAALLATEIREAA